jgi:cyclic pyranopterin phosphate synthase
VLGKVANKGRAERIQGAYDEIIGASAQVTHLGPSGEARMVHIGEKPANRRTARAETWVCMSDAAFTRLEAGDAPKGDVLGTARLAGIMAAKKTGELIPLCHPLALTKLDVEITKQPRTVTHAPGVRIEARVEAVDRTGVEMEALTAASVAGLTVYDMLKAFDREMSVGPLRLLEKTGGRSGDFKAAP